MSDRARLEAEIDATREHLAETVDALGDKFDVKGRAQEAVAEADKGRIAILAGAAVAAVVGIVLLRRG